ncbi:MAG: hypothetical protein OXO49_04320 [Gammaproteobacteria bacterium]|nr:hypothetical protein [Gammaproteobacteria bacterium]MDE0252210.1 hypothetical protein [Gammaproteobacteria bacterium]MDE0402681.1 hypothetical protein [Gammaproteobacteria bacterium]
MTSSIYHFFLDLVSKRGYFLQERDLESFDYDTGLIANFSKGRFPDVVLRTNKKDSSFSGGEFIEFKNTNSYSIASFNSTIPTGAKSFGLLSNQRKVALRQKGYGSSDDEIRSVYYLIRGRVPTAKPFPVSKVCLVHGAFFETVASSELIRRAFQLILQDFCKIELDQGTLIRQPRQEDFAQTRSIESSAVKIRFRIMTEVDARANLLRESCYPLITDNTLSLIMPLSKNSKVESTSSLVEPHLFPFDIRPFELLRRATRDYKSTKILDDLRIGVLRHAVDDSVWFIAQASLNIYDSVY